MNIIIFSDNSHSFIKPISEGLSKTLKTLNCNVTLYYDGNNWLQATNPFKLLIYDISKFLKSLISLRFGLYTYRFFSIISFWTKKRKLEIANADCIIVVFQSPSVFYRASLPRIEFLRNKFPNIPIVSFESKFLPNQGWYGRIQKHKSGFFGLERFDWYLCGSLINEFAFPREIPKIYSLIGQNLIHPTLFPNQDEFTALIDFKRVGFEAERMMQIDALEELGIPYIELSGRYTNAEIRYIYSKTNIYFIACRESFGLPILEIQLCGGLIFTPYSHWVPAHFLNKDLYEKGHGDLGSNFYVYNNDKELLKLKVIEVMNRFDAEKNVESFKLEYPLYYTQDKQELSAFLNDVASHKITSMSHLNYAQYNKYISVVDDALSSDDKKI